MSFGTIDVLSRYDLETVSLVAQEYLENLGDSDDVSSEKFDEKSLILKFINMIEAL